MQLLHNRDVAESKAHKVMNRLVLLIVMMIIIWSSSLAPAYAQTEIPDGYVVEGILEDPTELSTAELFFCYTTTQCDIADLLYPKLFAIDPETQYFTPNTSGNALVMDWEISADGRTYTFFMRDDLLWSDGEPVTAQDVLFTMQVRERDYYEFAPITLIDDLTFQMTFDEPTCNALNLYNFHVIPAHLYDFDSNSFVDTPLSDMNLVTSGMFEVEDISDGHLSLSSSSENVSPSGYTFANYPSNDALMEALRTGEINFWRDVTSENFDEVQNAPSLQSYTFNNGIYDYIGLNFANPDNPQPGLTINGEIIEQEPHPIFGDVRVRRALQHAIDANLLVNTVLDGYGSPIASYIPETSWAYNSDLEPLPYDLTETFRLLEEAGWVIGDDNILVAENALYADDGTEFRFTILVSDTSVNRRLASAEIIRDFLLQIGIVMEIQVLDFVELLDILDTQTFDAFVLSWATAFPDDPYPSFFLAEEDIPGNFGFNFISYYNSEIEKLAERITAQPACDMNLLRLMYQRVQQILQDDNAYLWLYAMVDMYAVSNDISGFDPYPNMPLWNVNEWSVNN